MISISERLFSHECTEFWNSSHLYLCDVDACYHVGVQSENSWRTRKGFPDYFEGKQSTLSNQKPASYECETSDGFSFINLGGLGSGLD